MLDLELYVLTEGRVDVIRSKYNTELDQIMQHNGINLTGDQAIEALVQADPTSNNMYTQWIVYQAIHDTKLIMASLDQVHTALTKFDKFKNKLPFNDIFKYKTLGQLLTATDQIQDTDPSSGKDEKRAAKREGIDKILNDASYLVAEVTTEAAAKLVGRGTKWCVSGESNNEFNNYNSRGTLYIIVDKSAQTKYMLFIGDDIEFKAEDDTDVDLIPFMIKHQAVAGSIPADTLFGKYLRAIPSMYKAINSADIDTKIKQTSLAFIFKYNNFVREDLLQQSVLLYIENAMRGMSPVVLVDVVYNYMGIDPFSKFGLNIKRIVDMNIDAIVGMFNDQPPFVSDIAFGYRSLKNPLSPEEESYLVSKIRVVDLTASIISSISSLVDVFKKVDVSTGLGGQLVRISHMIRKSTRPITDFSDIICIMAFYNINAASKLVSEDAIVNITTQQSAPVIFKKLQSLGFKINKFMMDNINSYYA